MKVRKRLLVKQDGYKIIQHEVENLKELLEVYWIKAIMNSKDSIGLCYSDGPDIDDSVDLLLYKSENNRGEFEYQVIGYLYGDGKELGLTKIKL